jgi:hypothetical protein
VRDSTLEGSDDELTQEQGQLVTNRPLILLDVDGVLNILSRDASPWDAVRSGWAIAEGNRYRITWSPEVIDTIKRWLAEGVEIQWLTTWGHDANNSLRHLLGLPELPVAGTYDQDPTGSPETAGDSHASVAPAAPDPLTGQWWKYDVACRIVKEQPDRTLIWVDDELRRALRFRRWAEEHPRVHPVGPDCDVGLVPADLEAIEALLLASPGPQ